MITNDGYDEIVTTDVTEAGTSDFEIITGDDGKTDGLGNEISVAIFDGTFGTVTT
jgi:hypothetical protein